MASYIYIQSILVVLLVAASSISLFLARAAPTTSIYEECSHAVAFPNTSSAPVLATIAPKLAYYPALFQW